MTSSAESSGDEKHSSSLYDSASDVSGSYGGPKGHFLRFEVSSISPALGSERRGTKMHVMSWLQAS